MTRSSLQAIKKHKKYNTQLYVSNQDTRKCDPTYFRQVPNKKHNKHIIFCFLKAQTNAWCAFFRISTTKKTGSASGLKLHRTWPKKSSSITSLPTTFWTLLVVSSSTIRTRRKVRCLRSLACHGLVWRAQGSTLCSNHRGERSDWRCVVAFICADG